MNYSKKTNLKSNSTFKKQTKKKKKNPRQLRDIKEIQNQIKEMKEREINFYRNLRLDSESKEKIFGIKQFDQNVQNKSDLNNSGSINNLQEKESNLYKEKQNSVNGKVIVQDPLKGNLIMTVQDY